jgi:phosphoenolpyruvate-protein kinase (PTS system EI component)
MDVRLLDVGADKNPLYLHLPPEPDPSLGRRGVRVLLEYPELLEAQLRAVLAVSQHFPLGVLIPMGTTESDVAQGRAAVSSTSRCDGDPPDATPRRHDRNAGGSFVHPDTQEARGLLQYRLE